MTKPTEKKRRKSDYYNDESWNYLDYWDGRDYEHAAEELAITKLLKGRHYNHAVDVGGGYGRLCVLLEHFADKVTLAEPSQQQLDIADDYLKDYPKIERLLMQASDLKFDDGSIDLVIMVRVMHHLPDPNPELSEIARILSDDGRFILEVANYSHARNRLKHLLKFQKMPKTPVDIRSKETIEKGEIDFVNHNPRTVIKQLAHAGLKVEKTLSVSNLRSPGLKKIISKKSMLAVERALQKPLAKSYFGPSVFFLIKKAK